MVLDWLPKDMSCPVGEYTDVWPMKCQSYGYLPTAKHHNPFTCSNYSVRHMCKLLAHDHYVSASYIFVNGN